MCKKGVHIDGETYTVYGKQPQIVYTWVFYGKINRLLGNLIKTVMGIDENYRTRHLYLKHKTYPWKQLNSLILNSLILKCRIQHIPV